MEKRTPHCNLAVVKALVAEGKVGVTNAARLSATVLGFDLAGMLEVVLGLTSKDFYKSMTTYSDQLFGKTFTSRARARGTSSSS